MKISIKDFSIDMVPKNKGVEFEVRDNADNFLGDFIVNKKGAIWCNGKQSRKNAAHKTWEEIIEFFLE